MDSFSSTRLTSTMSSTKPLQLISEPMVKHSLHTSPLNRAATAAARNLAKKATRITAMTYPHVMPSSSKPRLVDSPLSAKYSGKNSALTRSSIFSVSLIANPPSCGQIKPTMNAPKIA